MEEALNLITIFISNCGFPIAACIMMFLQNNKLKASVDENTKAINSMRDCVTRLDEKLNR